MADIIKFIFSFFTIWSLTLYILYLFIINNTNYIPSLWITNFIISLIITIGIYGTIIIHYNKQKIIKKYKVSTIEVILTDLLIHILPLIHVLYNKNKYISMSNISDDSFIIRIMWPAGGKHKFLWNFTSPWKIFEAASFVSPRLHVTV